MTNKTDKNANYVWNCNGGNHEPRNTGWNCGALPVEKN
jgi:hypothetical protein